MAKLIIFSLLVASSFTANAETIVVAGKAYEIRPAELSVCGEAGGPENTAAMFLINFAQSNGEKIYEAACASGIQKECGPGAVKKFGIQQLFPLMRKYPSGLKSEGCKSLRDICEKRCKESGQFEERTCVIECNQYETWNP